MGTQLNGPRSEVSVWVSEDTSVTLALMTLEESARATHDQPEASILTNNAIFHKVDDRRSPLPAREP